MTVSGVLESSEVLDNAIHQVFIKLQPLRSKHHMLLDQFTYFQFNFCKQVTRQTDPEVGAYC
jgi:hypothetical protein